MKTDIFLCTLIYFCQSIIPAGSRDYRFRIPGLRKGIWDCNPYSRHNHESPWSDTNSLSVAEHVQAAISSCAQTLYALRILRAHGMDDTNLRTVYQSVSISVLFFSQPFCQW